MNNYNSGSLMQYLKPAHVDDAADGDDHVSIFVFIMKPAHHIVLLHTHLLFIAIGCSFDNSLHTINLM